MQTNGPTRLGYTILPDGKCSKNVHFIWMVPCTADTILSQNAALHFVWARMMRDIIPPRNDEQWTRAPRRGYPTGWAQQSIPQYCGILICCRMQ